MVFILNIHKFHFKDRLKLILELCSILNTPNEKKIRYKTHKNAVKTNRTENRNLENQNVNEQMELEEEVKLGGMVF